MSERVESIAREIVAAAKKLLPVVDVDVSKRIIEAGSNDYLDKLPLLAEKLTAIGEMLAAEGQAIKEKQGTDPLQRNILMYLQQISFHLSNAEYSLGYGLRMLVKLSGYMNTSMTLGELLKEEE